MISTSSAASGGGAAPDADPVACADDVRHRGATITAELADALAGTTEPFLAPELRRLASDAAFAWWWHHPQRVVLEEEALAAVVAGARLATRRLPAAPSGPASPTESALALLARSFPTRRIALLEREDVARRLGYLVVAGYALQSLGSTADVERWAAGVHRLVTAAPPPGT